jgi:enolase
MEALAQREIDERLIELDGTPDKSRLGANTTLSVSLACAHAAAAAVNQPLYAYLGHRTQWLLPMPMINIISGGLHAGQGLTVQDFLIIPIGARSFSECIEMASHVRYATLAVLKKEKHYAQLVADEGGFAPTISQNEEALEILVRAVEAAGYFPGRDVFFAVDIAASHLVYPKGYELDPGHPLLTSGEVTARLDNWKDKFPLLSVEDALAEEDWEGWKLLTECLGTSMQLVGDDLFATNPARLERGVRDGVANAILIKPNQIGTLTETLEVLRQANAAGYQCIISARSGETEDTTIADLAVATGAGQIKIGSLARSSRLAKYNQILRIEEEIGADRFVGRQTFERWISK